MNNGIFIALEGLDGCGKTTIANELEYHLLEAGLEVTTLAHPSNLPIGAAIKSILRSQEHMTHMNCRALTMAFVADMIETTNSIIKPALQRGHVVITDRYIGSTLAYQTFKPFGGMCEDSFIMQLAESIQFPSITLFIDARAEDIVSRITMRGSNDKYDASISENYVKFREHYINKLKSCHENVHVVDNTGTVGQCVESIIEIISEAIQQ